MDIAFLGVWLLIPLAFVVYFYGKPIHRNEYRVYLMTLILSLVLSITVLLDVRIWLLSNLIIDGHLSFALFTIVMFGGAFPLKTKPKKYLMQIRREFALVGFLLLIPHAVLRLDIALSGYNFTGILAFLLMIPLVIVSYPKVRKRIMAITWKRIHKMAYVVYLFIYIHVGFDLFYTENYKHIGFDVSAWPYHIIFIIYLVLKIYVLIDKHQKKS